MNRILFTVLLAALALSLSSCGLILRAILPGCEPVTIRFDSADPDRVFRGVWTGTVNRYPNGSEETQLVLDVSATFVDADSYQVSGTLQLGSESPMAFDGHVDGACAERYAQSGSSALAPDEMSSGSDLEPQMSPPRAFLDAEARDDADTVVWEVDSAWYLGVSGGVQISLFDPDPSASNSWHGLVTRNDAP